MILKLLLSLDSVDSELLGHPVDMLLFTLVGVHVEVRLQHVHEGLDVNLTLLEQGLFVGHDDLHDFIFDSLLIVLVKEKGLELADAT